jgi:hypothetical protein
MSETQNRFFLKALIVIGIGPTVKLNANQIRTLKILCKGKEEGGFFAVGSTSFSSI